jgi:alkylated DNA nucleotide flippase Atl1
VALGEGSPRSVGGALRNNPFAPRIPCHRVIASSFFVGGFKGEWAPSASSAAAKKQEKEQEIGGTNWHRPFRSGGMRRLQNEKVRMLIREGVSFGRDGKVAVGPDSVWRFENGGEPGSLRAQTVEG